MKPAPVFLLIGYGLGTALGLGVGLWLGDAGHARLAGLLTAWLGGGVLSLGVAYGWYRGLWLRDLAPAEDEPLPLPADMHEREYRKWADDLAAEGLAAGTFAGDHAADRAGDMAEIGHLDDDNRKAVG